MRFDRNPAIIQVFMKIGNATALANHLGVTRQAISRWEKIPIRHLSKIHDLTGIPVSELRPDLFETKRSAA